MTLLKTLALTALVMPIIGTASTNDTGEQLFKKNCSHCHKLNRPSDTSTLTAPPLSGIMRHVIKRHKSKENAVAFIVDYALDPQLSKALCRPEKIKHFGLMPSQKGQVNTEELTLIAMWMYDTSTSAASKGHACKSVEKSAKEPKKRCHSTKNAIKSPKKSSQFLIPNGMPHMTKLLKQQWDNSDLNLSVPQKEKLLIVRQTTMNAIKSITPRIRGLEKTIIRKTMAKEKPESLEPIVKKLAQLKAKATNVHIRCIYDTSNILTERQISLLSK